MNENLLPPTKKREQEESGAGGNGPSPYLLALSLAFKLGYMIALPAVLFALGGRYLDLRFDTSPLFLITGLLAALAASSLAILREIRKIHF